ncbi:MAG: hypothetical protein IT233_04305 [Bacteroidia bacterium]|nr:hypothetical protein [Bacteroidia bacterium]
MNNKPEFAPDTASHTATALSYWEEMEQQRFGLVPVILLIIGCLGGVAAGFANDAGVLPLLLVLLPTMVAMCIILAVMKMKFIVQSSSVAVLIDLAIILLYAFS